MVTANNNNIPLKFTEKEFLKFAIKRINENNNTIFIFTNISEYIIIKNIVTSVGYNCGEPLKYNDLDLNENDTRNKLKVITTYPYDRIINNDRLYQISIDENDFKLLYNNKKYKYRDSDTLFVNNYTEYAFMKAILNYLGFSCRKYYTFPEQHEHIDDIDEMIDIDIDYNIEDNLLITNYPYDRPFNKTPIFFSEHDLLLALSDVPNKDFSFNRAIELLLIDGKQANSVNYYKINQIFEIPFILDYFIIKKIIEHCGYSCEQEVIANNDTDNTIDYINIYTTYPCSKYKLLKRNNTV